MRRTAFLLFIALGLVLLSCGGKAKPPNVLMITIDTLRRDALGCYGNAEARTPALDRLAREGLLFGDAVTPMPLTLPSHSSLFTGVYPATHGARHNGLVVDPSVPTLAEAFRAAAYETAGFPASLVLESTYGIARGFETYDDDWIGERTDGAVQEFPERRGDVVADSFLRWLGARDRSRPFFAWVHFYDPHAPYVSPEPYLAAAGGDPYAGEVAFTDAQVGRLLGALEDEGLAERTIVTVLADHGEGLGEHGELEHGLLLYETTVGIPWILRVPGGPRREIAPGPAETVDLFPTMAGLLPIEKPSYSPGRDLLAAAPEDAEGRSLYLESRYGTISYGWTPLEGARRGVWKLVRGTRNEVFRLDTDPGETTDLAARDPDEARAREEDLDRMIAGQPEATSPEAPLGEEQRAMLEALGYVAPKAGNAPYRTDADPRDYFLAHQYLHRGRRLLDQKREAEAKKLFEGAIAIDSLAVDAMESLARCLRDEGDVPGELRVLRRILAIDPKDARAWNNLGTWTFRNAHDREEQLRCYDRAVEADSTLVLAHVNRGNTLSDLGRFTEAIDAYDRAIRLAPGTSAAHYGKGLALRRRGDIEGFARELQLAVRADPGFAPARRMLEELRARTAGESP